MPHASPYRPRTGRFSMTTALDAIRGELTTLRAPNKKRFWDAVVVDGVYGETFG
jgi:hypothetical protein